MNRPTEILLVEDNEADIELIRMAFEESDFESNLSVTRNGAEAMDFLATRGLFSHGPIPDIILLDLNMPRMDGKQFLALLKQQKELENIPVMLLTSSHAQHDVQDCYQLRAACYIVKPTSLSELGAMVAQIKTYLNDPLSCSIRTALPT